MSKNTAVITTGETAVDQLGGVYELIREDIISGDIEPNARLKVASLADRYGTSINPIREALQQLRGEGFVIIEANRGARVVAIDADFVRDITEIEVLIEPALTEGFVSIATDEDIAELDDIQQEIETLNFEDSKRHSELDTRFHQLIYDRHQNRHLVGLWWKHRQILQSISRRFPVALSRRPLVLSEHREIIACIRAQDAEGAAAAVARHVEGSGRHLIGHMRAAGRNEPSRRP